MTSLSVTQTVRSGNPIPQTIPSSLSDPATKWVRYAGHFGMPLGNPKFTHAIDPSGQGLGLIAKAYVKSIAKVAEALHRTKNCDPTRSLGARTYIQQPHVSSWKHVQVLSHPDLVCPLNSPLSTCLSCQDYYACICTSCPVPTSRCMLALIG